KDIRIAIESGKKFVFIETGPITGVLLGLSFLCIGFMISLILFIFISDIFQTLPVLGIGISIIPLLMFGIPGLIFIITALRRLRTAFIILGVEGIVYKLKTGIIKGIKWEDIYMDITDYSLEHNVKFSGLHVFSISMPNGDFLHFNQADYTMKEFPDRKQIGRVKVDELLYLTFVLYYNYRKKGTFDTII
ncbi:MAG: hypothetical protein ACXABG_12575, partial [Promethearchaeota archaeon]